MKSIANSAVLVFMILGMFAGCAYFDENPATAKLTVQYATLKVIGEDAGKAERVNTIVVDTLAALEDGEFTIALVEQAVRSQINWDSLDPADTLLTINLIEAVRFELAARLGNGVLSAEQTVQVREVLQWIAEAALLI